MSFLFSWSLILVTGMVNPEEEPRIDFSGVQEFARIVEILEGDEEPSPEAWALMFRTPGYAALTRSEFREAFFMDRFRLVFMPSRAADLQEALESAQGWVGAYLRHFVQVRERWDEVMAYVGDPRPQRMLLEARRRALEYLPPTVPSHIPPVAFVVFGPDARGYVPVVMDILKVLDQEDDALVLLLAHEFHHYYRNTVLAYDRQSIEPDDEHVLWVMDQLQAEGMANQVDLGEPFKDPHEFARVRPDFFREYQASADVIRRMDELLALMDADEAGWVELGLSLRRSIPSSGHPTGFFMANLAARELGMDRLVRKVGDPFAFLGLYHEAALLRQTPEAPPFSEAALRVIRGLEGKYVPPSSGQDAGPVEASLPGYSPYLNPDEVLNQDESSETADSLGDMASDMCGQRRRIRLSI